MAFSYVPYTGNGSTTNYTLPFSYISKGDIAVTVNGVAAPFTWISASILQITTAPLAGSAIQIKRVTQKTVVPVNFTDGSTLLEGDLDTLSQYVLYVAQEQADYVTDASGFAASAAASASAAAASAGISGNPTVQSLKVRVPAFGTSGLDISTAGFGSDPYGLIGVTRDPAVNYSYYGMTRSSVIGWSLGISTSNEFIIGTPASGGINTTITSPLIRLAPTGSFLLTASTAALGYGTGSGGTVSQAAVGLGVTLNKGSGVITMFANPIGAGATVVFTLVNSTIAIGDVVVVSVGNSPGTTYRAGISQVLSGSCNIFVSNFTGSSATDAVNINFTVIKGASA